MIITSTLNVDGYKVQAYKGIVRGLAFRGSASIFSTPIKICEEARQEAYDALLAKAKALGANAVLGFRYDTSEFYGKEPTTEIFCYGTAVVLVKE